MRGIDAYQSVKDATRGVDLRRVEAEALLRIARGLEEGQGDSLDAIKVRYAALVDNIRLWRVFFEDCKLPQNGLPEDLRNNILRLAIWVVGRSEDAIGGDASLGALVDINRLIARGLLASGGGQVDDAGGGGEVTTTGQAD